MNTGSMLTASIMLNRFEAIVEEMAAIVVRSAFTAFIKETGDIATVLISPGGEIFANPHKVAEKRLGLTLHPDLINGLSYAAGDVYISNDPRSTFGASTHLPDFVLWTPVFSDGQLVCFALGFVHTSDVGGLVPGSVSPNSVDIFQEGLILPPVRLLADNKFVEDTRRVLLANTRTPDDNWGDVRAMVGALRTATSRVQELVGQYSVDAVSQAIDDLLAIAERRARALIADIPDGDYSMVDYLDGRPDGTPIRIELTLRVSGSDIILDFDGTDPQVRASYNLFTHQTKHWQVVRALCDYFRTCDPTIPWNDGLLRPVTLSAPPGTLLNPTPEAACGGRSIVGWRIYYMTLALLSSAHPARPMPASGPGQSGVVLVASRNPATGRRVIGVAEPLLGGGGARPNDDGHDASEFAGAFLRNIPVESLEAELGVKVVRYGLRPDSGGPGVSRGGCGVVFEIEARHGPTTVVLRGTERYRFQAWGIAGGHCGASGRTLMKRAGGLYEDLGLCESMTLERGDRLLFYSPGGGGYGDPLQRPAELVLEDVLDELVSPEEALTSYGVVLDGNGLDQLGTRAGREQQTRSNQRNGTPELGRSREAYDRAWSPELHRLFMSSTSRMPLDQVQRVRERLGRLIQGALEDGLRLEAKDVLAICNGGLEPST